eukprot:CFRG2908T1
MEFPPQSVAKGSAKGSDTVIFTNTSTDGKPSMTLGQMDALGDATKPKSCDTTVKCIRGLKAVQEGPTERIVAGANATDAIRVSTAVEPECTAIDLTHSDGGDSSNGASLKQYAQKFDCIDSSPPSAKNKDIEDESMNVAGVQMMDDVLSVGVSPMNSVNSDSIQAVQRPTHAQSAHSGRKKHHNSHPNKNHDTHKGKGKHRNGGNGGSTGNGSRGFRDHPTSQRDIGYQRNAHYRLENEDDDFTYGDDVVLDTSNLHDGNRQKIGKATLNTSSSLNHLLRFSYGAAPSRSGRRNSVFRRQTHEKGSVFRKGQYMQANCQFVLRDSNELNAHLRNPDKEVDWETVEEVRMFCTANEVLQCPICLSPPSPAKTTRCGHVYCWACVLHYLDMSNGVWSECPICHEPICAAELRSLILVERTPVEVNEYLEMCLLVKRGRTAINPVPVNEEHEKISDGVVDETATLGHHYDPIASTFCNLLRMSVHDVEMYIIARERAELDIKLNDSISCGEVEEVVYLRNALELLSMRCVTLHTDTSEDNQNQCKQHFVRQQSHAHTVTKDKTDNGRVEDKTYFYQASDGKRIYIHSLNVRCLVSQFGSLENCPPRLLGKVLDLTEGTITEETRKKVRYLSHLPLTTQYLTAELDITPYLSAHVLAEYKDELSKLQMVRERKILRVKQEEAKIAQAEQAEANSKLFNHDMKDFPLALGADLGFVVSNSGTSASGNNRTPTPTADAFPSMSAEDSTLIAQMIADDVKSFAGAARGESVTSIVPSGGRKSSALHDWPTVGVPTTQRVLPSAKIAGLRNSMNDGPRRTFFTPPPPSVEEVRNVDPLDEGTSVPEWAPDYQKSFSDSLQVAFVDLDLQQPREKAQGKKKNGRKSKQVLFSTNSQRKS